MNNMQTIALSELQRGIKSTLSEKYAEHLWVHAEIGALNVNASGHCFLELVEKDGMSVKAKMRATIWAFTFRLLKPYFESSTGLELSSGIKVAFKVNIEYHEVFGISLNIKDVNPAYTVGDIELQRKKIIQRLEEEGVMNMNTELDLPQVPQRIAVISSKTAAGYGDWKHHIENNEYGYCFTFDLYEAAMQGESTSQTVINALDQIYERENEYDLVVLIRGGGSKLDLMAFDTYELAINVAQFPLPVLCGIGHERDQSIIDLVAHTSLKTPTAVADFLIDKLKTFEEGIDALALDIVSLAREAVQHENHRITIFTQTFRNQSKRIVTDNQYSLNFLTKQIHQQVRYNCNEARQIIQKTPAIIERAKSRMLEQQKEKLEDLKKQLIKGAHRTLESANNQLNNKSLLISAHDPEHILKRGFTMIKQNGNFVKSSHQLKKDKPMEIIFKDGSKELKIKN